MKSAAFKLIAVLIVALSLGACRSAPIYNVESAAMATPADATLADVTAAIKRAGAGLGWQMIDNGPGKITGKLYLRSHIAIVDIAFDTKQFSITYQDSTNLNYDGRLIHKNYNGWIQNLERAIQAQATAI